MNPIRILIVDDHPIVRTGIAGMLRDDERFAVVGQAQHGAEALALIPSMRPDVLLLDLRMPVMDGSSTIRALRAQGSNIGILVLTTYDTDADILAAIEAGANGYLLKDATRQELVRAIEETARGATWLTPNVAARVLGHMRRPDVDQLSARELEVLRLVVHGLSNKEIAAELHVSQATIKSHLIHVFRKLEVNDRTAAVTVALERGILTLPAS